MQEIITNSTFDYLWVQFYNNPGCSVNTAINYDAWKTNIANTPSANAKIFIGVPASPLGATGTESDPVLPRPYRPCHARRQYDTDTAFGGVMMWSAGFSDSNVNNGCTYAQEVHSILSTGTTCSGSGPGTGNATSPATPTTVADTIPTATTASLAAPTSTTAPAATATGTVDQWGQVSISFHLLAI